MEEEGGVEMVTGAENEEGVCADGSGRFRMAELGKWNGWVRFSEEEEGGSYSIWG